MGFALALPSNSKTQRERVTKGKPSSLLGLVVSFFFVTNCGEEFVAVFVLGKFVQTSLGREPLSLSSFISSHFTAKLQQIPVRLELTRAEHLSLTIIMR